jgi:hypothetical protein
VGPFGSSGDPLASWLGSSGDPLLTPYLNQLANDAATAYSSYMKAADSWEGIARRYAKTVPADDKFGQATVQLQLAEAAQAANDLETAIESYKTYLRLAPGSTTSPLSAITTTPPSRRRRRRVRAVRVSGQPGAKGRLAAWIST